VILPLEFTEQNILKNKDIRCCSARFHDTQWTQCPLSKRHVWYFNEFRRTVSETFYGPIRRLMRLIPVMVRAVILGTFCVLLGLVCSYRFGFRVEVRYCRRNEETGGASDNHDGG